MGKKPVKARPGPKPRHGETMVGVSIRLRQRDIDELDRAAARRGWARADEIRERLQDTFAAPDPVEAQARGMGNLFGLLIEEIQRSTGQAFDFSTFNQVVLHHAARTLIPKAGGPVEIPETMKGEAYTTSLGEKPDSFAAYVGMRSANRVLSDIVQTANPGRAPFLSRDDLSPERVLLLRSIYRDLSFEKRLGYFSRGDSWAPGLVEEGDDQ